jgi:hypothetical protein
VATAARDYLQNAFPNATVSIRNSDKESLEMVFTRLIMTNMTVCGPSTFCVYPAIASLGESYILHSPLFGGSKTWLNKVARGFRHVHYVKRRYYPSIDLYKLSTADIVNKLRWPNKDGHQAASMPQSLNTTNLQTKALAAISDAPRENDACSGYQGILHIQHGDPWAAGTAMFFLYIINYLQYAEEHNLLPWVHLDNVSERIYDAQVHGVAPSRSFPVPSRMKVTHDCGEDQICKPRRVGRPQNITVNGNGVWESYFEPVSSFTLDNPCYLPYLTFSEEDEGRMHYGWLQSVRAWHYIESVPPRPKEGHLHEWYGDMRVRGARIVEKYYKPKPWLVAAIEKANPSKKCMSMHVRFTDKSGGREMIDVDD